MFRSMLVATAFALVATAPAYAADAQLRAAVASPDRSAENKARDGARHPAETLTFWGLKPRQTVIEVSPGGAPGPAAAATTYATWRVEKDVN